MNAYGYKDIDTWRYDKKVPKGTNRANVECVREIRGIIELFTRNNVLLYFLVAKLGISDCRTMMNSGVKQKAYMRAVVDELKVKMVTKEYVPVFAKNIKILKNRAEYVQKMILENVRLTEYYPFFAQNDFQRFLDFQNEFTDEEMLSIQLDFQKFKEENPEVISAHMEAVKPEIERREAFRRQKAQREKAEKEYKKEIEKLERERQKIIDKEVKEREKRENKLKREFQRYYH